jgi:hypothetical protein
MILEFLRKRVIARKKGKSRKDFPFLKPTMELLNENLLNYWPDRPVCAS